ncbi:MAG TPA: DUF4129 domain-containing protein [Acidimicrobiales bacterium]|nr:DUF4129 domain-containing protein [Acidimicrobiales bacterium]
MPSTALSAHRLSRPGSGRALARRRLGRRPDETMEEHAARLTGQVPALSPSYGELARLAAQAAYSAQVVTDSDARAGVG